MSFINGIRYNIRGLAMGLKTPKLLILGITRFLVLLVFAGAGAALALSYHDDLLRIVWLKPESVWIVWLWHIVSWLTALAMVGISTVLAYLVSQVLFSVFIMDLMSRITEKKITGNVLEAPNASLFRQLLFLIRQEIPRTIIPVLCLLAIMILGWLTPLGPASSVVSSVLAAVFLAWDHTDLVPARRMVPFKKRFSLLVKTFLFHLGFGLLFLVPVANILLLSFAPVGATLFQVEQKGERLKAARPPQ
jgi:CysZ protein